MKTVKYNTFLINIVKINFNLPNPTQHFIYIISEDFTTLYPIFRGFIPTDQIIYQFVNLIKYEILDKAEFECPELWVLS